jgi:RNA polymerase sigma-70 factor (ECF subfamily)
MNTEDARDLAQESFLKLWQHKDKITEGKEMNFLFTIANNLFIDKKRREKVNHTYLANHVSKYERENPEFCLLTKEFNAKVNDCIMSMPVPVREVFIKNKIEKMTYAEIAEEYGITVKAIEKRMGHALRSFRYFQSKCA